MKRQFASPWFALLLGFVLGGLPVAAQIPNTDGPRWLRIDIPTVSIGTEVEALREDANLNGARNTHEYLSVIPLLGGSTHGSIYHPDLIKFDLSGEGGVGWAWDRMSGVGYEQNRDDNRTLLRYLAQVNFLSAKPYNATFFAAQDHTYQNYEFFNTAIVDSLRYGGHAGWTTPALSLNANVGYRQEQTETLTGTSELDDTYVDFTGIHNREFGNSTLTYGHNEYTSRMNYGDPLNSVNNYAGVSDSETFGSRKHITATAGANVSRYEYFDQATDTLNANGTLTIEHSDRLESFANANYTRNSQEDVTSSIFQGLAGVRHRLYESLISTADIHGSFDDTSGTGGDSFSDRYGIGLREDYTKRLGETSRLSLGGGAVVDHEDHESPSAVLTMIDEPHTLFLPENPNFRPAYLNQPRVITSTIQVRAGGIPAVEGIDYFVVPAGELTEIRLARFSTLISDGERVLVSYQSASGYTASFESLNAFASFRLDLYNTFGIYGRLNWLDNNAPPQVITETLVDLVGGVDARWRWFRAGAEYEDFDSNFTQYKAWRFFETFTYRPGDASSLGVEFNQLFYKYPDGRDDTQYQFIGRYTTQLTTALGWNVEAGYFRQNVFGVEQNLAAARTDLSYTRGKLSGRVGYQYNYQLITQDQSEEERNRNFFYLSLRRYF